MEKSITYFEKPGKDNTDELIACVKERLTEGDIKYVAIASASGESALKLYEALADLDVTIVNCTHHMGFKEPNKADITPEMINKLENLGITTFMGSHALSATGRGITNKFGGFTPIDMIAASFRCICQGFKVCAEIAIMLADAGLVPVGEEIITIGGTAKGVDTAVVMTAANMTKVFEMKFHEIIAMPRP